MAIARLTEDNQSTSALAKANEVVDAYNTLVGTASLTVGTNKITWGTNTPEAAVVGIVGDLFLRTDGGATTTLYVKTSGTGNTGWTAK
jgi:hypothetical protein